MARKISVSQYNQMVRRHNSEVKRHIDNYNREVNKAQKAQKQAIDDYNRQVRAYNALQNRNITRYNQAVRQLNSSPVTYSTSNLVASSRTLITSYETLSREYSVSDSQILSDWPQRETTNSLDLVNALNGHYITDISSDFLSKSEIEISLGKVSSELGNRWKGALFALNHNNPDACRHFCTSAREILDQVIDCLAPDSIVISNIPDCEFHESKPSRRSKIRYIINQKSLFLTEMTNFVLADVSDIVNLFRELNSGTHGSTGRWNAQQLIRLKKRVEDSIQFILMF